VAHTSDRTGFDVLVESAFDFLSTAMEEVNERPKFSIMHFFNGIELLLKARLLSEHWALVTAKPGEVSKNNFASGDFESVSPKQCIDRLERICEENLKEERECFLKLAAHRNQVVHFYHEAYSRKPNKKLLEGIVKEQLKAGAYLIRLLRGRWEGIFSEHDVAIRKLERKFAQHKNYLRAKFETLVPQLKQLEAAGTNVRQCFFCHFKAAEELESKEPVDKQRCLLCGNLWTSIRVKCPDCVDGIMIFDGGDGNCNSCDAKRTIKFLIEEYGEAVAHCSECSAGNETVIEFAEGYLCLSCANSFQEIGECGWCSETVAGDLSESYLMGCCLCEGHAGWHKDD
jgi:hypothetical protein